LKGIILVESNNAKLNPSPALRARSLRAHNEWLHLCAVLVCVIAGRPSVAAEWVTVFSLDEEGTPTVRTAAIQSMPVAVRAILALYALEVGGGCSQEDKDGLQCELTAGLGLGPQCSPAHVSLVRSWFSGEVPAMAGYAERMYQHPEQPGVLERICYSAPFTATRQRVWKKIRVRMNSPGSVVIDAMGTWLSQDRSGGFQYITTYSLTPTQIDVLSHVAKPDPKR
jgi:hypothetical protein